MKTVLLVLATLALTALPTSARGPHHAHLYPELKSYIKDRVAEFDQIPAERKKALEQIAVYVAAKRDTEQPAPLNFICTHNSRRSHMSQIWAGTAAAHFRLDHVRTYSGGTESTAFNPRAVAALTRAGFEIDKTTDDANPIYHVRFADDAYAMTCFSKVFDLPPNPGERYAAVMTCSDAAETCPFVPGADVRIAVPYIDPKVSDSTPKEAATYDERCAQIAREMLYAMSRVAEQD